MTAVLVMTEIAVPIWQLNFLSNSLYEFESKSKGELKQSRFTEVAKRPLFYWSSPISIKVEIIKKKKDF